MSKTPEISVILPSHNGMKFLPTAVQSILQQTFANFELILLDDGSTDETPQYAKTISDHRLRYVRLEKVGLVGALNTGLKLAKSELIARMDADDIALPTRLARQHELFSKNSRLLVCSTLFEHIDENGHVQQRSNAAPTPISHAAIAFHTLFSPPFLHPGTMFRREEVLRLGGYDRTYDVAEDYELWTRLLSIGTGTNINEILLRYRLHGGKVSTNNREKQFKQSSIISSKYAASVVPSLTENAWAPVRDLILNRCPVKFNPALSLNIFRLVCKHFKDTYPSDPSLNEQIQYWGDRYRHSVGCEAKAAIPNLAKSMKFLTLRRKIKAIY